MLSQLFICEKLCMFVSVCFENCKKAKKKQDIVLCVFMPATRFSLYMKLNPISWQLG